MSLLDGIKILAGLREASEESAAQKVTSSSQRTASGKLSRPKKKGGGGGSTTPAIATSTEHAGDSGEVSAAPSPRIVISAGRLSGGGKGDGKASRAGSVAGASIAGTGTREPSVKIEARGDDGAESVASSTTDAPSISHGGTSGGSASKGSANRPSNRIVLRLGEIVFCRHDLKTVKPGADPPEGEGILCRVTSVIGEGKQRRYEVQDADPAGGPDGEPPQPQRVSVAQLLHIPENNKGLPDLAKGRQVMAQYPDTTTFYKAEVSENWKAVKAGSDTEPGFVRLNFQDDEQSREVERRFVLTER
jgi:SAGA-associated factor 29